LRAMPRGNTRPALKTVGDRDKVAPYGVEQPSRRSLRTHTDPTATFDSGGSAPLGCPLQTNTGAVCTSSLPREWVQKPRTRIEIAMPKHTHHEKGTPVRTECLSSTDGKRPTRVSNWRQT
jgi:hypothetical protein